MADNKQQGGAPGAPEGNRGRSAAGQGGLGPSPEPETGPLAQRRGAEAVEEGLRRTGDGLGGAMRRLGEGADDAARRTGEGIGEAARRTGEGIGEVMRRTGEGIGQDARRTGEDIGEAARRATDAMGEAARRATDAMGEAARRATGASGEAAQSGLQAAAEGHRQILDAAAQEFAATGLRLAEVAREAAEGMRALILAPGLPGEGLRDAQSGMTRLIDGVIATNMRILQEMLRRSGPGAFVELQQRWLRDHFDAFAEGGSMLLRVTRQAAEEQLRPLEQHLRGRQARGNGQQPERDGACVAEVMAREVRVASPEDSVQQAARMMAEEDTGALPVGENDRLVGMVTDRDLALRVTAEGRDPARTRVREVMTGGTPQYVFEDEPLDRAAEAMAQRQVRRLPVLNRQKRLVGMLSLGDLSGADRRLTGRATREVIGAGWARHHEGRGAAAS